MYDHYIGLDWAQSNMALARMTQSSNRIVVTEAPADLGELKLYLGRLKGRKVLTFEETTTAQWLYTELKSHVSEILVCDPYRNKLLSEGAKNDRIDAAKLVQLLRANLLKPVFHSGDEFIGYRKIVSAYEDLVKAGVRLKNQRSALFRAKGLTGKKGEQLTEPKEQFVLREIDESIDLYETQKSRYEEEFKEGCKSKKMLKNLLSIPGIGEIGAYKIAALVVDPRRFPTRGHFIVYCGLIRFELQSGGKSYGTRKPRYSRALKCVFKTAAMSAILHPSSEFGQYYRYLIEEKNYPEHEARHAVARRIAVTAYGVMKTGRRFEPTRRKSDPA